MRGLTRSRSPRWIAAGLATLFVCSLAAEAWAVPQWRQRRWLSRPPIDPTIRPTVSFRSAYHAQTARRVVVAKPVYRSPYHATIHRGW